MPLSLNSLLTEKLSAAYMELWQELNGRTGQAGKRQPLEAVQRVVYDFNGVPLVCYRYIDSSGNAYAACGRFEQKCIHIYSRYCEVLYQMGLL